jgi:hypothetical protein
MTGTASDCDPSTSTVRNCALDRLTSRLTSVANALQLQDALRADHRTSAGRPIESGIALRAIEFREAAVECHRQRGVVVDEPNETVPQEVEVAVTQIDLNHSLRLRRPAVLGIRPNLSDPRQSAPL